MRGLFFPRVGYGQVHATTSRIQRRFGTEEEPTVTKAVTVATSYPPPFITTRGTVFGRGVDTI